MSYEKIRNKTIPKYLFGNALTVLNETFEEKMKKKLLRQLQIQALGIDQEDANLFSDQELNDAILNNNISSTTVNLQEGVDHGSSEADALNAGQQKDINNNSTDLHQAIQANAAQRKKEKNIQTAVGIAGEAVTKTLGAVDEALMGDKNFSASSQGIDAAVHGTSKALMKSGNPYAMAAGVALEGLNFLTKAGGRTVPGYDVKVENSGYSTDMMHLESESGRIWDKMGRKLRKRNEKARMALNALDISNDQQFEQEARANSVDNILQLNQIALAGGIDTSLLAN